MKLAFVTDYLRNLVKQKKPVTTKDILDATSRDLHALQDNESSLDTIQTVSNTTDVNLSVISNNLSANLTTTGVTLGIYGSALNSPQFTVDSKGRISSVSNIPISLVPGAISLTQNHILVGNAANIAIDVTMSSEASILASGAITLSNSAVINKVLTGYISGAGVIGTWA